MGVYATISRANDRHREAIDSLAEEPIWVDYDFEASPLEITKATYCFVSQTLIIF